MDANHLHVHQFKETVVPPTCRECGYTLYTCDCGYEHKANYKPIVPHSFQVTHTTPATCSETGSVISTCTTCGEANVRSIPPMGHDFGQRIIQVYPTCQEPGSQVCRCSRCGAVEEHVLNPIGHSCVPETARYDRGKLVEFFCQNCGQTIRNLPSTVNRKKYYWPTRIILFLAAITTLANLIYCIVETLVSSVSLYAPWFTYSRDGILIAGSLFFFFTARAIKENVRYPRWLGVPMLIYAGLYVGVYAVELAFQRSFDPYFDAVDNFYLMTFYIAPAMVYFVFSIICFCGAKKRWAFSLILLANAAFFGAVLVLRSVYYIAYLINYVWDYWQAVFYLIGNFSSFLKALAIAMLIVPKKRVQKPPAVEPAIQTG